MIGRDVFSLLVLIMFGYILLAPIAINFAVKRAKATYQPRRPINVPATFARHALEGITVNHVLDRTRSYPPSTLSIREFADSWVVPTQHDYVVVDDGSVTGIVSLTRLRFVPKGSWGSSPLRNVLRLQTPHAFPEEPIDDVLKRMTDYSLTVIPVVERETEEFLGTVISRDIMDLVILMDQIAEELEIRGVPGHGAASGDGG